MDRCSAWLHASPVNGDRAERDDEDRKNRSHGAYYNLPIRKALAVLSIVATACSPATRSASVASHPAAPASSAAPALQRDIDTILADAALARGYWGVLVASLGTNETLYALNARRLFVPASNMKIVTLAAAAQALGWDFTYSTTVRAAGSIADGVLDGDLVVVGSGDPSLVAADGMADRVFADWAAQVKRAGIRAVTGRIVADAAAFNGEPFGAGWMWDDLVDEYSAGIGALQLNEDAVRLSVTPGPAVGSSAAVALTPFPAALTLDNSATTSAAGSEPDVHLRRWPGVSRLQVSGTIPLGHAPIVAGVSVPDATQFFVDALRAALVRNGIDVRQQPTPTPRPPATTLVEYRSPPLSTLAMRLMKTSQNQYAETLFRTVGGRDGVLRALQPWGVAPADLIQRDGSGLSRYDLVTPQAFVTILTHIANDARLRDPFERSLPIAGDLGLTNRMKGTAAEGNARAKTGSMTAVRGLSGYVADADGEPLVFSILANNFEAEPATINQAMDAIVVRLAQFKR